MLCSVFCFAFSEHYTNNDSYKCPICNGTGIQTCLLCMGAGGKMAWRCMTMPPYSTYYDYVACIACQGKGQVMCTWCSGTGDVNLPSVDNQSLHIVPNNSGNSSGGYSSSSGSTCGSCRGTGNCTMCKGRGGYYHNTGTYTGTNEKTWTDCPACNGSRKCQVCYGRGSIR